MLKFSLKKIQVPLFIQDSLKTSIVNKRDRVLFRLKFEVGEFYCYTSHFPSAVFSNIELKEDLALDLNNAKYLKVSLVASKGRLAPYNLYTNEFLDEEVVAFVNLRTRDFEDQASNEILHSIEFNKQFYNPKEA